MVNLKIKERQSENTTQDERRSYTMGIKKKGKKAGNVGRGKGQGRGRKGNLKNGDQESCD